MPSLLTLRKAAKAVYQRVYDWADNETRMLVRFVRKYGVRPGTTFLDVGCGYGRTMKALGLLNLDILGVEKNPAIVTANNIKGLKTVTVDQFQAGGDMYDVILMSHIIEHFAPEPLKLFMDTYLDRLKTGGYLILATPLMSSYFYDDFDHIKPYQPTGIDMVFGEEASQVQYYSRNVLRLSDLWFRRSPFRLVHHRGRHMRSKTSLIFHLTNFISAVLFLCTMRRMGRADGWIGVYQKIGVR